MVSEMVDQSLQHDKSTVATQCYIRTMFLKVEMLYDRNSWACISCKKRCSDITRCCNGGSTVSQNLKFPLRYSAEVTSCCLQLAMYM